LGGDEGGGNSVGNVIGKNGEKGSIRVEEWGGGGGGLNLKLKSSQINVSVIRILEKILKSSWV